MELSYPISNSKPLSIHLSIQKILFKFIINKNNVLSIKSESGLRTKNQTLRASFFMSEISALPVSYHDFFHFLNYINSKDIKYPN
ncbi:hypothetical protein NVI2019_OHEONHNH_03018 [Providencia alcalifaciens]|nr:hypothetical protein NVI2019_OHEONHNH_03018 [Providencia alcalifaciens]CAG9432781.1 hypothetical protein NVI2019_PLFLNFOB_03513 [Providencia alcalifaciens]CAG9432947.1 hypothetical protein NVI2019_KOLGMIGM_03514 [Providencia alcalifaciens]CAG9433809.1 hypothetical protein NVI2019_OGMBKCAO_03514 [Providencia alcalifaciens]CAG9434037.1 hypothetical protein NVI2019_ANGEOOBF_03513 [Providencia alcalifaciens]